MPRGGTISTDVTNVPAASFAPRRDRAGERRGLHGGLGPRRAPPLHRAAVRRARGAGARARLGAAHGQLDA
jgi:hypothetical protein